MWRPSPPGLAAGDVVAIQDCLRGDRLACLLLGKSAAQTAGFPLGGVGQGAEQARRCAGGNTTACTAIARSLVGNQIPAPNIPTAPSVSRPGRPS